MRNRSFLAVAVILALLPGNLAWGQANLPNNANAATVQGPDPTGMLGYPLATVPATGALPWPCAIQSFAASLCVTQCTSPWVIDTSGSANRSSTGTLNAVDSAVSVNTEGMSSAVLQINATLFQGIIQFEESNNGGANWYNTVGRQFGALGSSSCFTLANFGGPASGLFQYKFNIGASSQFRARASSYTTGSAAITLTASAGASDPIYSFDTNGRIRAVAAQQTGIGSSYTTAIGMLSSGSSSLFPLITHNHLLDGVSLVPARTPRVFNTVATAAAGNTALWTPTAGKRFRLMRYMVTVTDQATQAGAGTLTFSLFDGAAGVTGQVHDVFVPALGLVNTGSLYSSGWIDLGNGYLSTAANNVLNINLSAALTAGTVRVICCGTEE